MALRGKNVRVRGPWWHYQFEAAGKVFSGSTGLAGIAANQTAAETYAARRRWEAEHPALAQQEEPRRAFDEAAAEFHDWARNVEYRGKPSTAERLRVSMASAVAWFGDRMLDEIGAPDLEGYKRFRIEEHGVRDITLRHDLHGLSVFFQWAVRLGYAALNPLGRNERGVRLVSIPSDRDAVREHVVTPEEEELYLATALALHAEYLESRPLARRSGMRPNLHDLAVLMLELGARPEELLAARQDAVDLAAGTLRIAGGKTRAARRTLYLTARARGVIEARLAAAGTWVFPSERRPGRHVTKLQCTHDRVCREAGLSFVLYDLRHTWATRAVAAGVDVPTVAAILGHSGLRTVSRYVHPTAETQRAAMERYAAASARRKLRVVG